MPADDDLRLEPITGRLLLHRPLLTSARFAPPFGSKLMSLGRRLKGITAPQEIFAPPEA